MKIFTGVETVLRLKEYLSSPISLERYPASPACPISSNLEPKNRVIKHVPVSGIIFTVFAAYRMAASSQLLTGLGV